MADPKRMTAWDVYEFNYRIKPWPRLIDTVFYTADCDAEYVRTSLINHDHYSPHITVAKRDK